MFFEDKKELKTEPVEETKLDVSIEEAKVDEKVEIAVSSDVKPEETKAEQLEKPSEEQKDDKKEKGNVVKAPVVTDIPKLGADEPPFEEASEAARKVLLDKYKASKRNSRIMMVVIVAVIIGAMLLITLKQQWATILGYALAALCLVGLLIYYLLNKDKFPKMTKGYINDFTVGLDKYIFSDGNFTNVKLYNDEKVKVAEVLSDQVYKNIYDCGSRNVVRGLYYKRSFFAAELALYTSGDKKNQKKVCFLGKYITYTNSLEFDGRIILVKKPVGEADKIKIVDQPTNLEGLELVEEDGPFMIYAPAGVKPKDILGTKFISAIKKVDVKGIFLNFNVCVWGGHTALYLSYDDPVVTIPFDKPYNKEPQELYKSNLMEVMEAARIINK